jgi:NAD-dependent dihydropyrimidine dehydrogenase PreA subunit
VISVEVERCTGCGACVEACPTGALYLVEGKATLDGTLCYECEACLAACPTGAITLVMEESPVVEAARLPALQPEGHERLEPEVVSVSRSPAPLLIHSRALPLVGAALAWAGREILPELVTWLLETRGSRTAQPRARGGVRGGGTLAAGTRGAGRRRRQRRRGGSR